MGNVVRYGAAVSVLVLALVCLCGGEPIPDPAFGRSAPEPGLCVDGEIVRVIDGDTVICRTSFEYRVRLLDCWAPESRTRDAEEKQRGLAAKARMVALCPEGQPVRVLIPGSRDLSQLQTMGRLLGRVWVCEDGRPSGSDLSAVMVSEGFATETKTKGTE